MAERLGLGLIPSGWRVSEIQEVARCQDQLSAFCGSGVDMPILMPPLGVASARTVIQAFRR